MKCFPSDSDADLLLGTTALYPITPLMQSQKNANISLN